MGSTEGGGGRPIQTDPNGNIDKSKCATLRENNDGSKVTSSETGENDSRHMALCSDSGLPKVTISSSNEDGSRWHFPRTDVKLPRCSMVRGNRKNPEQL
jgi:hypothetical protein